MEWIREMYGGLEQDAARRFELEYPAEPSEWVPMGHGFRAPSRMQARLLDARYPVALELEVVDGRPVCTSISRLTGPARLDDETNLPEEGGRPLTGDLLRKIPIAKVMREMLIRIVREEGERPAVSNLVYNEQGRPELVDPGRGWMPATGRPGGLEEVRKAYDEQIGRRPRRGSRITDAQLEQVAEVYRVALSEGLPPTQAVQRIMQIERSTAGRWVWLARSRGFLPPTEARRARA